MDLEFFLKNYGQNNANDLGNKIGLDELMGEIQLARPNANIEVVSYSNGVGAAAGRPRYDNREKYSEYF